MSGVSTVFRNRKWLWVLLATLLAGGLLAALNPNRLAKPLPASAADEAERLRNIPSPAAGTGRIDSRGVEQVWVPPGCFRRGTDPARERGNWYETPQHDVCLTRGFWIDKYEVTNAAFTAFADQKGYPWGDEWDVGRANVGESGHGRTVAVDDYANGVSWCGAFHMAGNVREWTSDWYAENLYREHVLRDPVGLSSALERVVRGGSYASTGSGFAWFSFPPDTARVARRSSVVPTHRSVALGMRVVSFE